MKSSSKNIENPFELYHDEELIMKARELIFDIRNIPFNHDVTPIIQEIFKTREVFMNACINEKNNGQRDSTNKINARMALLNAINQLIKLLYVEREETEETLNNSWSMLAKN